MYNVTGSYSVITQELLRIGKQLGKVDKANNSRLLSNVFIHLENDKEIPEVNFYTALNVSPLTTLLNFILVVSGTSNINLISCLKSDKDMDKVIVSKSDDNNCLNAPLGERLYYFNKNDSQSIILNPVNQLEDAYNKLKLGLQANISFYNPLFDNITCLAKTKSKDYETLIGATFYLEDDKLCMNVLDSTSSLEELFSYKLSPLILIQSILANWINKEIGNTNYLVTTLKVSQDIMIDTSNYENVYYDWGISSNTERLGSKQDLSLFLDIFWSLCINDILAPEDEKAEDIETRLSTILDMYNIPIFWEDCLLVAYISRYIKLGNMSLALKHIKELKCNDWKVSILRYIMLYFIDSENIEEYESIVDDLISSYTLDNKEVILPGMIDCLQEYLKKGVLVDGGFKETKANTRGTTEFII